MQSATGKKVELKRVGRHGDKHRATNNNYSGPWPRQLPNDLPFYSRHVCSRCSVVTYVRGVVKGVAFLLHLASARQKQEQRKRKK